MTQRPRRRRLFELPWRGRRKISEDIEEEFRFHLDARVETLIAGGMPEDKAREKARTEFGDMEDARLFLFTVDRDIEAARRRSDVMDDLKHDIVYAWRKLATTPAFTLAVLVTLALGIGATSAIFSVVHSVLLRPLAFPQAGQLVRVRFTQQGHGDASTPPDLADYGSYAKSLEGLSVIENATSNIVRPGADPERVIGARVGANWFSLLRSVPVAGRFFAAGEDKLGAPNVVVLSEELWRRDFGGDRGLIGKPIRINSENYTVIGVAPAGQHYPLTVELWMTKRFQPNELGDNVRGARWLGLFGRVKDGVSVATADAEILGISKALERRFPEPYRDRVARAVELQTYITNDLRTPLYILMAAVAAVLLIACANVANLLLVRASSRETEMAVRVALGAGRARLVRQLITEAAMLSIMGAAAGLLLARVGMQALLALAPGNLLLIGHPSIDATTVALAAGVVVLTSIVFGIIPARGVGRQFALTLRAGGRGGMDRPSGQRAKRTIVVAEVALAVVLLSSAGLLLRSFTRLIATDPGFRPDSVMSMRLLLPGNRYANDTVVSAFTNALNDRLSTIPGARTVGLANIIPLDGNDFEFSYTIRGRPVARPSDEPSAQTRMISPGFLDVMGMPLVAGRGFTTSDRVGAPPVVIISQALAKQAFPTESPIGHYLVLGWSHADTAHVGGTIVGVVGDVRGSSLSEDPDPTVYVPLAQVPSSNLGIVVRTATPPSSLVRPIRQAIHDLDAELPVYDIQTMSDRVSASVGPQRFYATLIAIFAGVALLLAAVGLYGVIAYTVSQRTRELGVRMALGATAAGISRLVVREAIVLTVLGTILGLAGTAAASRFVSSLLFGVQSTDPLTFAGVFTLLIVVTAFASYFPARRAGRVDPNLAMRGD